jgi:hypothetical protein
MQKMLVPAPARVHRSIHLALVVVMLLLSPFQIVDCFGKLKYIDFSIYLNTMDI